MKGDRNKVKIGEFADGSVCYRLVDFAGVKYYTIEIKGIEFYSEVASEYEPQRMIDFYCDSRRTVYCGEYE